MPSIALPIIRSERGDVEIFAGIRDAEMATEHYDVKTGEYQFWDVAGQELRAEIDPTSDLVLLKPTGFHARGEATRTLERFMQEVGIVRDPEADLEELVRLIWSWQAPGPRGY